MVWFNVDDGFWSHPKVLELPSEAIALWVRAGSYCAKHLTDGQVKPGVLRILGGDRDSATELVLAGLWTWDETTGCWWFHDWSKYQRSKEQVEAEREATKRRVAISRDTNLRDALKARDGDWCRYCGVTVKWTDRKGSTGATYDHVDPFGPDTFDNLVVACRGCNSRKGQRTPEQAGMTLRPEPNLDTTQIGSKSRDQAQSSPIQAKDFYSPSESQSSSTRARVSTDPIPISASTKRAADRLGVTSLRGVVDAIHTHCGVKVTSDQAYQVALWILEKRDTPPGAPQRYVTGAIAKSPHEVQQHLYEHMEVAS